MCLLSIIVPLYNNELFVRQCLESICNQSLQDIDIIVVDDGSTDKSGVIADEMASCDDRITVIHQQNKGLKGARYSGLINCKTEYATFVDSDDFILENSYQLAEEYMNKHIDMIFFEISRYFDEHNIKREKHIIRPGYYDRERIEREVYEKLIWDFDTSTRGIECSQCVRVTKTRYLIEGYEKLGVNVMYGEDMVMTYPLYKRINNMQVVPYSYYMHRQYINESRPYIVSDLFLTEAFSVYKSLIDEFCSDNYEVDFRKQIDYLFFRFVQEKKRFYEGSDSEDRFMFPFDKTLPNKRIILYGAGDMGKIFYRQLTRIDYCKELLWVDKNAKWKNDNRIKPIESIMSYLPDYVVIAIKDKNIVNEVRSELVAMGISEELVIEGSR